MTWQSWTPCPAQFLRRWAVQGARPEGDRATTIFDLRHDRAHVAVYPATVDTFALLIDRAGVEMLLTTVESRNACTVPGMHAVHGPRLLGLRPYDTPHAEPAWTDRPADAPPYGGPMALFVHLPNEEIRIIYGRERLRDLQAALTEILALMR